MWRSMNCNALHAGQDRQEPQEQHGNADADAGQNGTKRKEDLLSSITSKKGGRVC